MAVVRTLTSVAPVLSILAAVSLAIWRGVDDPAGYGSVVAHRAFWWAILWSLGGVLLIRLGLARRRPADVRIGAAVTGISGVLWLLPAALIDRVLNGVADVAVAANIEAFSGVVCVAALVGAAWLLKPGSLWRESSCLRPAHLGAASFGLVDGAPSAEAASSTESTRPDPTRAIPALFALAALLLLCLGSLEIERAVPPTDRVDEIIPFAAAAVSIWWGLFGAGLVVLGFAIHTAFVRHAGLALLGLTALKFLLLDLRGADSLWRVAAMVIVGLLFVGVSVLYVRREGIGRTG